MVSPYLAQIGIPLISDILRSALGAVDHPIADDVVKALARFDDAVLRGQIDIDQMKEAHRHVEEMSQQRLKQQQIQIENTHGQMKKEMLSKDKYVRRMRPTFGYLMAITWAAQMLSLAYIMMFRTSEAHLVISSMESLSMIWTIGLSVLGIYVYKRSEEKMSAPSRGDRVLVSDHKIDLGRKDMNGDERAPSSTKGFREGRSSEYNH